MKNQQWLHGKWQTDPADIESIEKFGRVTLEFKADGRLIYTIHELTKDQIIFLNYRMDRGMLITDQPSAPREERTPYGLTSEGKLVLTYDGFSSTLIKVD